VKPTIIVRRLTARDWKKAAEPLQKGWVEAVRKLQVDPDAALNDFKAQLARYNAGY
jgi:hypothetical protein